MNNYRGKKSREYEMRKYPASLAGKFHALCESFSSKLSESVLAGVSELSIGTRVIVTHASGDYFGVIRSVDDTQVHVRLDHGEPEDSESGEDDSDTDDPENGEDGCAPGDPEEGEGGEKLIPLPKDTVHRDASWVKKRLSEHRSLLDLPIFPSSLVFNGIVSDFIEEDWEPRCYKLLNSVMKLLRNIITRVLSVDKRLVNYPRLAKLLKTRMDEGAQALFDSARADLANYLEKEKKPYTQNDYLTENITRLRLQWLQRSIYQSLGLEGEFDKNGNLSKTQVKTTIDAIFNRNRKKSLDNHMAEDLQHCLDAYGKVAYKRFADEVPKICKEILVNYARHAEASLSILPDEEKLDELISVSTESQEKYRYLRGKVSDLEEGLRTIESLSF